METRQPELPKPASAPGVAVSTTSAVVLAFAALYLGRDVFIPLALAILFSFVLTPLIAWLRRWRIPDVAAVIMVFSLALTAVGGMALLVASQLVELASDLPVHERNIKQKLANLRDAAPGGGWLERVSGTVKNLGRELSKRDAAAEPGRSITTEPSKREPLPVVVEPPQLEPLESLERFLGPIMGPIGTAGLVLLFTIFILIERDELRDRFIKLVGGRDLQRSTEAITEAGTRVSRYLLMQLIVNVTYGIPIAIGLYIIGVPNSLLWGVFAAVLRFIPYLGPWIAALFPIAMAFGVDTGWSMLLWTIALFLAVELVSNNVIEPWLYGASTGLSSFAIVLAAIVWTVLWGPIGLILATPMTVCLVVIGRYVPSLEFLGIALGSEPVLTPAERFYQRLLAGHVEEALELAERQIEEKGVEPFWDQVALPALRLAEDDRQRGADVEIRRTVAAGAAAVARDLLEPDEPAASPQPAQTPPRVLCIGGRTELDHAAAEILAGRLRQMGIDAEAAAPMAVARGAIGQLPLEGLSALALCYLNPRPEVYARYVLRRIERRAPQLSRVACLWNVAGSSSEEIEGRLGASVAVALTISSALEKIAACLNHPEISSSDGPLGPSEQRLQAALRKHGLTAGIGAEHDWLAAEIARELDIALSQVMLVDETCAAPAVMNADKNVDQPPTQLTTLVCGQVMDAGNVIVVEDVSKDERFSTNADLLEKGIQFFAAAPLRANQGGIAGALCVFDSKARAFGPSEQMALEKIAERVVARVT